MVIYTGPGGNAGHHSHHAIQLIRSFDSSFELVSGGKATTCRSALIPSGLPHSFNCDSSRLLIALIEPLGPRGTDLNTLASDLVNHCLNDRLPPLEPEEGDEPLVVVKSTLLILLPDRPKYPALSPHVISALAYLDEAIEGKPSIEEAAAAAGISSSRLTHVFTEEIGIPFRNFVLWLRLRRVVDQISEGANLTEAAFAAGFSDSPHLSKAFREHFGMSPSALLRMRVAPEAWPV
jgi:AraC-like DNA-binding protein